MISNNVSLRWLVRRNKQPTSDEIAFYRECKDTPLISAIAHLVNEQPPVLQIYNDKCGWQDIRTDIEIQPE